MSRRGAPVLLHLLRALLPGRDRDVLHGELERLYRARRARWGPLRAHFWLLREAGAFGALRVREAVASALGAPRGLGRIARGLARSPGFTALAVGTLALGVGSATLVSGVAEAVLVRPLPYPDPDRLVSVWDGWSVSRGELEVMQRASRTLASVGAWTDGIGMNVDTPGGPWRMQGAAVSPELLDMLGVAPVMGRRFETAEAGPDAPDVVLLAHDVWLRDFGGERGILGRTLPMDGRPYRVVGVLPPRFSFPDAGQDFLVPLALDPSNPGLYWGWGGHHVVGRLAPGASPEDVRLEMLRLFQVMRLENPLWTPEADARNAGVVVPLHQAVVGDVRGPLLALLAAVTLVLVVVCANVANLLLSRGLSRGRDAAVRAALGAGRGRILAERLTESVLLSAGGAGVGVLLAGWALAGLRARLADVLPRAAELGMDPRLLTGAVSLAILTGVLSGVLPAWRAARSDPAEALREGGRSGLGTRRRAVARTLVIAQVAAAVVLVTGAGLLVRTLDAFGHADLGFDPSGLTVARVAVDATRYPDASSQDAFFQEIRTRVAAAGPAERVAFASSVPFGASDEYGAFAMDGVTENPDDLPVFRLFRVSPDYFTTLRIPVLDGRRFAPPDEEGPPVVIVDETAARRFWPGESPLGRVVRFPWRGAPAMTVVGVAGPVTTGALAAPLDPVVYLPFSQWPTAEVEVVLRAGEERRSGLAVAALRDAVGELDAHVPVSRVAPYSELLGDAVSRTKLATTLLSFFGAVALLLGCVGVYGVVAFAVRERTGEFGVRMALGARPGEIRRSVLRDAVRLAVGGAVLGLVVAVPGSRLLEGLLWGVEPLDPVTYAATAALLLVAALLAAYLPARRATRIDPADALRSG